MDFCSSKADTSPLRTIARKPATEICTGPLRQRTPRVGTNGSISRTSTTSGRFSRAKQRISRRCSHCMAAIAPPASSLNLARTSEHICGLPRTRDSCVFETDFCSLKSLSLSPVLVPVPCLCLCLCVNTHRAPGGVHPGTQHTLWPIVSFPPHAVVDCVHRCWSRSLRGVPAHDSSSAPTFVAAKMATHMHRVSLDHYRHSGRVAGCPHTTRERSRVSPTQSSLPVSRAARDSVSPNGRFLLG